MRKEETKRDKFVRLAEARTNKILEMIALLGNCSNTNVYEYTQKDIDKIFKTIQSQLDETKKRFSKSGTTQNSRFTLD